jgi:MFS family permease
MLDTFRKTWREFPPRFWVLVIAGFIDTVGATLIFPFFTLYVTEKFKVGLTEAGALLGLFSIFGLLGSIAGGALADRFGRRSIVLFGLVVSALSTLAMGFVDRLSVMRGLAIFVGLLSNVGGPARQAMVADLLPEEQRSEGFGILRVGANMAWIVGPTIGGFLASRSYLLLFVLDAIISTITAGVIFRYLSETRPEATTEHASESIVDTLMGYGTVLRDSPYMAFLAASVLMLVVYQQLYSTLSVFLRDERGISTQGYGFLLSINAATVVLLQFWVTRKAKAFHPMAVLATASGLYVVGFLAFAWTAPFAVYVAAMLVITLGEMLAVPVGQSLAASFAPQDMRGRYAAIYGLAWAVPSAVGPWAAGLIVDRFDPNWVWYSGGILCAVAALAFLALRKVTPSSNPQQELRSPASGL